MGSRRLVRGPLALYWLMTMMVAAGAVAVATAPSTMQVETGSFSPRTRWSSRRTTSTKRAAERAWMMAMTVACLPVCFKADSRNSLPMEKAMKPRATSQMRPKLDTSSNEAKPIPGMPKSPRQLGPMSTPATKYAVTAGRCQRLISRLIIRPARRAKAIDKSVSIQILPFLRFVFQDPL